MIWNRSSIDAIFIVFFSTAVLISCVHCRVIYSQMKAYGYGKLNFLLWVPLDLWVLEQCLGLKWRKRWIGTCILNMWPYYLWGWCHNLIDLLVSLITLLLRYVLALFLLLIISLQSKWLLFFITFYINHRILQALMVIQDMLRVFIVRVASEKIECAVVLLRPIFIWLDDKVDKTSLSEREIFKVWECAVIMLA